MSISVLNTDAGLSGKTIVNAEDTQTLTGAKTFDLDPNPPFVVTSGSGQVTNLRAERAQYASEPYQGQFAFPAAQNASSGANTLDDYEEGTWTPTLTSTGGGAPTYTVQEGIYVKTGQNVTVAARLTISSKNTLAAGTLSLASFPFAAFASVNSLAGIDIPYFTGMTTSASRLSSVITANATSATMFYVAAAGGTSAPPLAVADISNGFDIVISCTYRASA